MRTNIRDILKVSSNDIRVSLSILNDIAMDPNITEKILIDVITHSNTDQNILLNIANNPNATSIVLANIIQHPKTTKEVLTAILKNQNTDSIVLEYINSTNASEDLEEILITLLNDQNFEKKHLILNFLDKNLHNFNKILKILTTDPKTDHLLLIQILLNQENLNEIVLNFPNINPEILIKAWENLNKNLLIHEKNFTKLKEILNFSNNINQEMINYVLAFTKPITTNPKKTNLIFNLPLELISYILKLIFPEETKFVLPIKYSTPTSSQTYTLLNFSNYEEKIKQSINNTLAKKHTPKMKL